jgi:hypothetical protein
MSSEVAPRARRTGGVLACCATAAVLAVAIPAASGAAATPSSGSSGGSTGATPRSGMPVTSPKTPIGAEALYSWTRKATAATAESKLEIGVTRKGEVGSFLLKANLTCNGNYEEPVEVQYLKLQKFRPLVKQGRFRILQLAVVPARNPKTHISELLTGSIELLVVLESKQRVSGWVDAVIPAKSHKIGRCHGGFAYEAQAEPSSMRVKT